MGRQGLLGKPRDLLPQVYLVRLLHILVLSVFVVPLQFLLVCSNAVLEFVLLYLPSLLAISQWW
jgi:hypothetical protein